MYHTIPGGRCSAVGSIPAILYQRRTRVCTDIFYRILIVTCVFRKTIKRRRGSRQLDKLLTAAGIFDILLAPWSWRPWRPEWRQTESEAPIVVCNVIIINIIIAKTSKAHLTEAQRRRTVPSCRSQYIKEYPLQEAISFWQFQVVKYGKWATFVIVTIDASLLLHEGMPNRLYSFSVLSIVWLPPTSRSLFWGERNAEPDHPWGWWDWSLRARVPIGARIAQ